MAKVNVPFHTVVFPSSLLGAEDNHTLLNHMSSIGEGLEKQRCVESLYAQIRAVLGSETKLCECCLKTINFNYLTHKRYLSRWFFPTRGGITFQELHGDAT